MRKNYIMTLLLLAFGATTSAATIYVNVNASGANNGSSWTNAYTNLQSAINASVANDQIWVAAGTYLPTQLRIAGNARSASFFINKNIKIYGGFNGTETQLAQRDFVSNTTILSGDFNQNDIDTNGNGINDFNVGENAYTVVFFYNVNNTTTLDGFKIMSGCADGTATYTLGTTTIQTNLGGAVYHLTSSAILNNLKLNNNLADFGAGIYNGTSSNSQLNNSEATYNSASYGSGVWASWTSVFTSNNTDYYFNRGAGTVGAINTSVLRINNGDIVYNSGSAGAGMYVYNSNAVLYNVKISHNQASGSGGGIYCVQSGVTTLYNTLISNNSASTDGGGIYNNNNSYTKLTNVTITANTAGNRGGGIYNEVSPDNLNTRIYNSIIWGNTAVTSGPAIYYTFYAQEDVHVKSSIIQGSGGSAAWNSAFGYNDGGNYAQDPLFINAGAENFALQPTSVGIDGGYNQFLNLPNGTNSWTANDADPNGYSRLQGAGVDMGAFEAGGLLGNAIAGQKHFSFNNPVRSGNLIMISTDVDSPKFNAAVYDINGKLVKTSAIDGASVFSVSTDGLESGVYFCRLSTADNAIIETLKVVIQ